MIAFGNAADGQLGLGGIEETAIHLARWNKHVKGRDIVSVGCGLKHTLLLLKEGRVLSCGSNEKGQLGQAESITRPGLVSSLQDHFIVQVDCGHHHSLALTNTGQVFSWGDGQHGQLGLGPDKTGPAFVPQEVSISRNQVKEEEEEEEEVVQIVCGAHHNLTLLKDGRVYSWGQNNHHQLGVDSGCESFVSVPTLITSLSAIPIQYMSAGFAHNVVVTRGGVALAWGRNSYGQLGIGTTKDQFPPCHLEVLTNRGKVVKYAACGDEHSLILTLEGEVYSCGLNNHGQLGLGSASNKDLPTFVRMLENYVCQVTCGRMHSAAMSHPAGDVFMFGQGSNGQVGVHSTKSLVLPTDINLGDPPQTQMTDEVLERLREAVEKDEVCERSVGCSKKLKHEIPEEGSSVDPSPLIPPASSLASSLGGSSRDPVHLVYAPRQVFCGGDQTFVLVDVVTTKDGLEVPSKYRTHQAPPPVDYRSERIYKTPFYMAKTQLMETLGLGTDVQLPCNRILLDITKLFSSSALMSGSFTSLTEDGPVSEHHPGVRMADVEEMMDLLRQKPSPTTTGPPLVGVGMRQTRVTGPDVETIDRTIQQAIQQNLLPSLSMDPCWVEGLRCLLVAPFWFMRRSKVNRELLLEYVRGILKLTEHDREVLMKWYFKLSTSYAETIWLVLKDYMFRPCLLNTLTNCCTSSPSLLFLLIILFVIRTVHHHYLILHVFCLCCMGHVVSLRFYLIRNYVGASHDP